MIYAFIIERCFIETEKLWHQNGILRHIVDRIVEGDNRSKGSSFRYISVISYDRIGDVADVKWQHKPFSV